MNMFLKRLLSTLCMVTIGVCLAIAQTNTVKHTVDRGETLASIAKRYATTEKKIIELNPEAAQFVYVGMVLTIPAATSEIVIKNKVVQQEQKTSDSTDLRHTENKNYKYSDNKDFKKWNFGGFISYGFPPKPKMKGISSSSFTFAMALGANYNITESFYVGAKIGYSCANTNTLINLGVGDYQNTIINNDFICVPIETGYRLYLVPNKIALTPYGGIDLNYVVKCKIEQGVGSHKEKKTINPKDRFGLNGRIGVRLNLWTLNLGCAYIFSFDDNFGDNNGFPEISLGFDF